MKTSGARAHWMILRLRVAFKAGFDIAASLQAVRRKIVHTKTIRARPIVPAREKRRMAFAGGKADGGGSAEGQLPFFDVSRPRDAASSPIPAKGGAISFIPARYFSLRPPSLTFT